MDRADNFICIGLSDIDNLLSFLDLVEAPLLDSVRNVNEEEAKKTKEKRNFSIEKLENIEESVRKVRAFMIYFNARDFWDLYNKITNIYIERFEHLKTIDKDTDKEIFYEWVPEDAKRTFNEFNRERDYFLSWLDFGHPLYIYEWRKQIHKKQHDKIIEIEEEPEEVDQVDQENKNQIEIKPIETEYKGYRFRSRLEARWAVFFDACGVDWEYEPEGYELGDGQRYLPDFVIHNVGIEQSEDEGKLYDVYVEIKGEMPKEKDIKRFYAFSGSDSISNERYCSKPLLLVKNIPTDYFDQFFISFTSGSHYSQNLKEEGDYLFQSMRFIKNNFSPKTAMFLYKEGKLLIRSGDDTCYYEDIGKEDRTFIDNAFKKARSARFEFGEIPDIKNEGE